MTSFAYLKTKVYYAQNREDLILESFFRDKKKGFYVDIGAYDPDYDSVTRRFYEHGWSGINIEPQAERHALFVKKRARDTNLNIGISNKDTALSLRSYANQGLSTFSKKVQNGYRGIEDPNTQKYVDIEVQVQTLATVFKQYGITNIDFMKIDVEGLEYEVIEGNDWSKYRPKILCIEANHILEDWHSTLEKNNYELCFNDGLNDYFIDKTVKDQIKFDYVDYVVLKLGGGLRYEDYNLFKDNLDLLNKHIKWLENDGELKQGHIEHQMTVIANQEEQIKNMQSQLSEKTAQLNSLRWTVKRMARLTKDKLLLGRRR